MRELSLEEKLKAQVKFILTIVEVPMPKSSKIMLLEEQKEQLKIFIDKLIEEYR